MSHLYEKIAVADLLSDDFDGNWGTDAENGGIGVRVIRSTDMRGGVVNYKSPEKRNIPEGTIRKKQLKNGDLLVNKSSGSSHLVGASVLFQSPDQETYLCSNFIRCLRPNRNRVDPEYLYFGTLSPEFKDQIFGAQRTTSGLRNLKISEYKEGKIPVPPLEEQRRIVARLKECMERVEEIERLRSEANAEREALFASALNKRFTEIRESDEVLKLEEVALIRGGASLPKGNSERRDNDILLVKVAEMNLPDNERVVSVSREYAAATLKPKAVIQPGAIIFPKRGGAIATNKKRILGQPAYIDPNLMAIEADPLQMDPGFLYFWSKTLDLTSISNGGVIPQLNRKDLAPLQVPVPHLIKQKDFAEEFEILETTCSQLATEFTQRDSEVAHLRDAILRKAFAGEL